jgi:hypothetical protein
MQKTSKKRKDHLVFINFGVKKFTITKAQKNRTLIFECYNLLAPKASKEPGVANF